MSVVIEIPEKERYHFCDPPYIWTSYDMVCAKHNDGSYWRCSCGKWYKVVTYLGSKFPVFTYYRRVRWYNFEDKKKILQMGVLATVV